MLAGVPVPNESSASGWCFNVSCSWQEVHVRQTRSVRGGSCRNGDGSKVLCGASVGSGTGKVSEVYKKGALREGFPEAFRSALAIQWLPPVRKS